jgi:membrane-associated phospholipid phosphatase
MPGGSNPRIAPGPGPFLRVAASRLDVRSRKGFPVTLAWVLAAVSFLGFLSIAEDAVEPVTMAMDRAATAVSALLAGPLATRLMWVATLMGDSRVMIVETLAAAVLLAIWGHPRRAASVTILVLTGLGMSTLLKDLVARPRPPAALALVGQPGGWSFPSGHAMAGVLLFGTLALMLVASDAPRRMRTWGTAGIAAIGLLIGLSRVYLGVHYFSDVLASWLLGAALLSTWAAAVLVWGRTQPPREERPARPWGLLWWRWTAVAIAIALVVIAVVVRAPATPLL